MRIYDPRNALRRGRPSLPGWTSPSAAAICTGSFALLRQRDSRCGVARSLGRTEEVLRTGPPGRRQVDHVIPILRSDQHEDVVP
jgi:hypothetical protein